MNERSSRSHTIFRLTLESSESAAEGEEMVITVSQLNLVDLAGSERCNQTGAVGDRFKEGTNINKSLLVLGQVISKLSDGHPVEHLGIRNSKLTRILKNSLGGNTRTAVVCTLSPAEFQQTKSTLEFASRAKKIVQEAHVNEVMDDAAMMKRMKKEMANMEAELAKLRKLDVNVEIVQKLEQKNEELEEKERRIFEQEQKLKKLQDKLISVHSNTPAKIKEVRGDALGILFAIYTFCLFQRRQARDRRLTWCGPSQRKSMRMSMGLLMPRIPDHVLGKLASMNTKTLPTIEQGSTEDDEDEKENAGTNKGYSAVTVVYWE